MKTFLPWCVALLAVVLCSWPAARYIRARSHAATALVQCELVNNHAKDLYTLKAALPAEARRQRPAPGLTSRLAGVVAAAGLPQATLQNVSPESDAPLGNGGGVVSGVVYRRAVVRLTLDPVTLPQLGQWLQAWRDAEPAWTVSAIDLNPSSRSNVAGPDKPIRVALVIETVFAQGLADGANSR